MKPRKCSIVIPVFNGVSLTAQCLESIWNNTPFRDTFEIIVVDNGSTDGTRAMLDSHGSRVRTLSPGRNLGFAAACNRGAREASHDLIVFLNNDTMVLPHWLHPLVKALSDRRRAVAAGSRLLHPDGKTIGHAGFVFRHDDRPVMLYRGFPSLPGIGDVRRRLQAVSGACMAVKREAFLSLGGFDEGYVNGNEDIDFCLRVGEKGWEVWYEPDSRVIHLEGMTEGRFDHEKANAERFRRRWSGRVGRDALAIWVGDGFDVINPKSRSLRLSRKGLLFTVRSGALSRVEPLPENPLARGLKTARLKLASLPCRVKYGRLLAAPPAAPTPAPRGRDGLRIAMVHPNLAHLGGAEKLQIWTARHLQERGHQVVIYTHQFERDLWDDQLPATVPVRLLRAHCLRPVIGSKRFETRHFGAVLEGELSAFDLVICHNPPAHSWVARARQRSPRFPRCLWFCHSVSRILYPHRAGSYAFSHEPKEGPGWKDTPILRLQRKHAGKLGQRKYGRRRRIDSEAMGGMDAIVANSRFNAGIFRAVYGRDAIVCEPGVPLPETATKRGTRDLVFFCFASRSPQKNLPCIVEAFRRFVTGTDRPDVKLRIAGDLSALRDTVPADVLGSLSGRIIAEGRVGREERLAGLYRSSFATIYIPVDEAFGLVPVESMAQGTPVIASRHGGPTETVVHGRTGLLVDPFDPACTARAMESLASLPAEEMRAMRSRARDHVLEKFTIHRFIDRLERIFDGILVPPPDRFAGRLAVTETEEEGAAVAVEAPAFVGLFPE
jgi:GT2 family glycosyltransferase/glycosyltransferase involved in cell wall biosynthesis